MRETKHLIGWEAHIHKLKRRHSLRVDETLKITTKWRKRQNHEFKSVSISEEQKESRKKVQGEVHNIQTIN